MATYTRFEDLPVWQSAAELYEGCDEFLEHAPSQLRQSFRHQLERAVLSVSNNIAEGFERGTTRELLAFNGMARGAAGEVRSMLKLLLRRAWMAQHKAVISDLIHLAESCSRQLRAWSESLQKADPPAPRAPNNQTRQESEERKAPGSSNFRASVTHRRHEGESGSSDPKAPSSMREKFQATADAKPRPTQPQTSEGKFRKRGAPLSNVRSGSRD